MYILTMKEDEQERAEGAYAVITKEGEKFFNYFKKKMMLLDIWDFLKPRTFLIWK